MAKGDKAWRVVFVAMPGIGSGDRIWKGTMKINDDDLSLKEFVGKSAQDVMKKALSALGSKVK